MRTGTISAPEQGVTLIEPIESTSPTDPRTLQCARCGDRPGASFHHVQRQRHHGTGSGGGA